MTKWARIIASDKKSSTRPYLLHTIKNERPFYFLVLVEPIKERQFLKELESSKEVDLDKFGTVPEKGYLPANENAKRRIDKYFN